MVNIDLFVLGFVFEKPMYGYEISQKVEERRFHLLNGLKKASIYKSLKRLEKDKLVESEMISQENHPQKKVYTITENGRREFKKRIKKEILEYSCDPKKFWSLLWIINKAVKRSTFKEAMLNRKRLTEEHQNLFYEKHLKIIEEKGLKNIDIPFYGFRLLEMVNRMLENEAKTIQNILNDLDEGVGKEYFIPENEEDN